MRYIVDSTGYIKELIFGGEISCGGVDCTEYTGSIPTGYESLESWYLVEYETLYRWKIVDGNLTLDETAEAPVEKVIVRMNGKEEAYFETMRADSTGCHHIEPYYSSNGDSGFIVYNDGVAYILTMASTGLHLRYYDQSSGQFIDYTLNGSGGSGGGGTGEAGVGILSVEQTTTSTADGGNNVITVTLTDGTKSTFTVKNGSKGSKGDTGAQGPQGPAGADGAKGETGAAGKDGTSVTVKSVSESTADGGSNVVTFSDGKTLTVKNGSKGSDGVNGKDGGDGVGIASMEVTQLTDADVVVDIWLTDNTNKQFGLSAPQGKDGATGPAGADGKSAYAYAQDGGYTGTEAAFAAKLAKEIPTALPNPKALTFMDAIGTVDYYTGSQEKNLLIRKAIYIQITQNNDGSYSASEDFQTIAQYAGLGWTLFCLIDGIFVPLMAFQDDIVAFGITLALGDAFGTYVINIFSDDSVNVDLVETAALKNPNALTINGTSYDGSSALSLSLAKKENGFFYIEGTGSTAGTWLGAHSDITAYYPGLTVLYKVPVAGASPTTLNINGLGAVTVVRNATTAISTTCPVDSVVMLTYTVDSSGTAYWKRSDYDANTKTTTGTSNKTGTKLFLTGATSQTSSGTTTYSNSNVYIGTNNRLYSGGAVVPNVDEINALIQTQLGVIENGSY